jgi:hypothetical protein
MKIRPIIKDDLDAILLLLCEGFRRRGQSYWRNALSILTDRPEIEGLPRWGWLLEDDNAPQGVLLALASRARGKVRLNLSSWYVREAYRKYATLMLRPTMRDPSICVLDLSPAANVVPIVLGMGYQPYTAGTLLLTPRDALRRPKSWTSDKAPVRPWQASECADAEEKALVETHIGYGCRALLVEDTPALYRLKWLKGVVPAARFVSGDPFALAEHAGSLTRYLAAQGVPLAMIDAPLQGVLSAAGKAMPEREIRYVWGAAPPAAGDLLETEVAVFGP